MNHTPTNSVVLKKNPIMRDILAIYRQVWSLNHSLALLNWDTDTYMPTGGTKSRGIAAGQLATVVSRTTGSLEPLVRRAEAMESLTNQERGIIRVLRRSLDYQQKVPAKLVNEMQRITSEATVVWRTARKKSDFARFLPYLRKILEMNREIADKLGYVRRPYDALIDLYEEGFTTQDADAIFSRLVPGSVRLLDKVTESGEYPNHHPLEKVRYDAVGMQKVNEGILSMLGISKDSFRIDIAVHPFTVALAQTDVRVATRYEGVNFKSALFSTVHEIGHALYGLQIDEKLAYSPLDSGASYGVHESQSRFWENVVGRNKAFVRILLPLLRRNLTFVSEYDLESLYYYFNTVRKSFIRVDADEITYNLHIAVRYEVEKIAINGGAQVSELPSVWNDVFEKYFGMRPRNDSEGILQDVQWSGGSVGNFPTYTLGNVIVGMIWHKLKDGEMISEAIERRNFSDLKDWLGTNIHRFGSTYPPKQLQKKVFGEMYNPERFLGYLDAKFR